MLTKQEYAELCAAIRTLYADRIPAMGYMLYKNHFYVYNYDIHMHRIECVEKIEIVGNEIRLSKIMEGIDGID